MSHPRTPTPLKRNQTAAGAWHMPFGAVDVGAAARRTPLAARSARGAVVTCVYHRRCLCTAAQCRLVSQRARQHIRASQRQAAHATAPHPVPALLSQRATVEAARGATAGIA
eukprot:364743-Chlamydomonas_euryale.AAC.77